MIRSTTRGSDVAEHQLVLLDTSCVIDPPSNAGEMAEMFTISTLTIAELAYGMYADDPMETARREERYREVLRTFNPLPYSASAAHLYGALATRVRRAGRNPRPRLIDLMVASVAASLGVPLVTRNPRDFDHLGDAVTIIAV